jgi:hypothetical protein
MSALSDEDREAARELAASFPAWTTEQLDELARLATAAPTKQSGPQAR